MSTAENHLRSMSGIEQSHTETSAGFEETVSPYIPESLMTADTGVTPDMEHLAERVRYATPAEIAMAVLQEVGIAPDPELVTRYKTETQDAWTRNGGKIPNQEKEAFEVKSDIIRHADLLAERVKGGDAYQRGLWQDYRTRSGQNVDKVMELYDETDAYQGGSVLKTITSLDFRLHGDDRVKDAERILRYMIRGEARAQSE